MPLPEEVVSQLPEDIRSNESLASFNDVGGLAKSYIETKALVGSSIRPPAKDSKPEDLEKWRGDVDGRLKDYGFAVTKRGELPPDKPEAYEISIEGVPSEQIAKDPMIGDFKKVAHELGLSNAGAAKLVGWYVDKAKASEAARQDSVDMVEDDGAVEKILSERFKGETKLRRDEFNRAVQTLSPKIAGLTDFLEGTAPNGKSWMANKNHPAMVQLLSEVARLQDQDFGGNVAGLTENDTLDSVDAQIASLRANKDGLDGDSVGKQLEQAYKKKTVLLKRQGR